MFSQASRTRTRHLQLVVTLPNHYTTKVDYVILARSFYLMPFPRKIHPQTPLKMIEPRKTVKKQQKQKQNAFHGNMNERTYIVCFTKQSFLRSFLISISAVTLKLISNGQNHIHFWLMQVLKNSMT